jgi:F0F1-type ATP synthase epsilon subunit
MEPNQQPTQNLKTALLQLHVRAPEKVIYEGEARAISSVNQDGPFDVLSAHENFITIIQDYLVIYDANNQKQETAVEKGVIRVRENNVEVYLGVETLM